MAATSSSPSPALAPAPLPRNHPSLDARRLLELLGVKCVEVQDLRAEAARKHLAGRDRRVDENDPGSHHQPLSVTLPSSLSHADRKLSHFDPVTDRRTWRSERSRGPHAMALRRETSLVGAIDALTRVGRQLEAAAA